MGAGPSRRSPGTGSGTSWTRRRWIAPAAPDRTAAERPLTPRTSIGLAVPLLGLVLAAPAARGQGFGDFEAIGRLEDARREHGAVSVGGHSFEPSLVYKLFGVTTPHVFGAFTTGYTDNLLQEDSEAPGVRLRREAFARLEGGVRLDTNLSDHLLELEYRASVTEYVESGEFDTFEHGVAGRLDLFFNDIEAHADLSWRRLAYAQSIQLRGLVRIDVYHAAGWGEVRLGQFGVRVGGSGDRLDYLASELDQNDHSSYSIEVQVYRRIVPKLRGLVEYRLGIVQFDEPLLNDYLVHNVLVGVDGELTPKLSVSLKGGYAVQAVDERGGAEGREYQGFTAAASVDYQLTPRTNLTLGYTRQVEVSFTSNGLVSDALQGSVKQRFYEDKITASLEAGWIRSQVSPGERLNLITAGAGVGWQVRQWLSVRADYQFRKLNSEFPLSDYVAHTVTLSVGVGF